MTEDSERRQAEAREEERRRQAREDERRQVDAREADRRFDQHREERRREEAGESQRTRDVTQQEREAQLRAGSIFGRAYREGSAPIPSSEETRAPERRRDELRADDERSRALTRRQDAERLEEERRFQREPAPIGAFASTDTWMQKDNVVEAFPERSRTREEVVPRGLFWTELQPSELKRLVSPERRSDRSRRQNVGILGLSVAMLLFLGFAIVGLRTEVLAPLRSASYVLVAAAVFFIGSWALEMLAEASESNIQAALRRYLRAAAERL
jgi:hypothetical protein